MGIKQTNYLKYVQTKICSHQTQLKQLITSTEFLTVLLKTKQNYLQIGIPGNISGSQNIRKS